MSYVDTANEDRIADLKAMTDQPRQAVAEARAWLLDCFSDDDGDIATANHARIIQGVEYHYEGGWKQFLMDALLVRHCPICSDIAGQHSLSCPTRFTN